MWTIRKGNGRKISCGLADFTWVWWAGNKRGTVFIGKCSEEGNVKSSLKTSKHWGEKTKTVTNAASLCFFSQRENRCVWNYLFIFVGRSKVKVGINRNGSWTLCMPKLRTRKKPTRLIKNILCQKRDREKRRKQRDFWIKWRKQQNRMNDINWHFVHDCPLRSNFARMKKSSRGHSLHKM